MAWSIIQTQEFEDWYLSQDEFTQLKDYGDCNRAVFLTQSGQDRKYKRACS
jgi:hypothetical protein